MYYVIDVADNYIGGFDSLQDAEQQERQHSCYALARAQDVRELKERGFRFPAVGEWFDLPAPAVEKKD